MKKSLALAALAGGLGMIASPALANPVAIAGAGAKIVTPLQISKNVDLYFGTIAPSLTSSGVVKVRPNGARDCGPQLTCLTADHSAAAFSVTGEQDMSYSISLPGTIEIANGNGDTMEVYDFDGSKSGGLLAGGNDSFTVGGNLAVNAAQPSGVYRGSFQVAIEYN